MEEDFVLYEEAFALKKIGFKERCFFAFDNCSHPMRCTDLRTNDQKFRGINYNNSTYTSQPSFSQAFRWFRRTHGLIGMIISNSETFYEVQIRKERRLNDVHRQIGLVENINMPYNGTYEEAELMCLRKLIEIVKNNNA